jgi:hypothetical protein
MRILTGRITYGVLALVVFWLARMSMRHEISTHASPPYRVALPFLKMMSTLVRHARNRCFPCPVMRTNGQEQNKRSVRDG